jgi:two-component system response regulator
MNDKIILLVEDNPDDADLTTRALTKNNLLNRVVVARDGAEAIDILHVQGVEPQLVLLDLKLPKLDGLGVLKRIRADERTRLLPVVVLTSSKEDRDVVESYNLGANSFVQKPVDFSQFMEAVGRLGLYWLVLNQPPPGREAK